MPAQPNQSLIDGLRVLQMLASHAGPIGSREMAARLDLEPTRANRLLGTLAELGLAEQDGDRKYRPGPGIHVLAAQSLQGSHLLACALLYLEALREEDLTVALGVLWQRQVCFLFHARSGMKMEDAIGTHELEPAGNSSIGVLFLAQHDDEEEIARAQEELASVRKPPQTPLVKSVAAARRKGYGRLDFPGGGVSLAVTIGVPPIAGIAASAKMDEARVTEVVTRLRDTAQSITRAMAEV